MRGEQTKAGQPRRSRRAGALLACLLWIVGVELTPNAHLWLHESLGDHDHVGEASTELRGERRTNARSRVHAKPPQLRHHHEHRTDGRGGHSHVGHQHPQPPKHESFADPGQPAAWTSPDEQATVARQRTSRPHGAHVLAHRGLAVLGTRDPWPIPRAAPRGSAPVRTWPDETPTSQRPSNVRARGPPPAV